MAMCNVTLTQDEVDLSSQLYYILVMLLRDRPLDRMHNVGIGETVQLKALRYDQVLCVEVFCGKARLSKSLRKLGFQVFSVGHRSCNGIPILTIDKIALQVKILDELLSKRNLLFVHFAPPCGTAAAAPSIRLSKRRHGPPPLRSVRKPIGLSGLKPGRQKRVNLANALYQWTCKAILKLHARGVGWSVEDPSSSLMWLTDPFQYLQKVLKGELTAFAFRSTHLRLNELQSGHRLSKCCSFSEIATVNIRMRLGV